MNPPRRILIACDKFKGSLTADDACAALARGLARRFPQSAIECRPIADGGEGFAASLKVPLSGRWIETATHGPLAVIEMAEASGMWRIPLDGRDILHSSTFGTGELMRHAVLENGAQRLVIGLGGSATNDGGAGMAAALGVRFLDADGHELAATPAALAGRLARIDASRRIALPPVTAACDVDSPLLGPHGATRVFGPQKGADETCIPVLEEVLGAVVRVSGGGAQAETPGAGAAGGLGFGLLHFADAELVPGFDLVASLTGLEAALAAADLVVTGEGSLDAQSLAGKGPVGIARLARKHGRPVIAICGKADAALRGSGIFDQVTELSASGLPQEILMARAAELLENAAAAI